LGPRFGPAFRTRTLSIALALGMIVSALAVAGPAAANAFPPLPIELGRQFVGNLSGPSLSPGGSGTLGFTVANPLSGAIEGVTLTLQVYAFNGFPGNATSLVPLASAPILTTPTSSGGSANVSMGSLVAGSVYHGSVGVTTSSSTPSGAYAVRTALSFSLASNSTAYRLESRGWFNASTWSAATELPNGSVTLNLSRLGVSGVTPETAILVSSSDWDWVLGVVLASAIVLAGAAAWVYFRRGPGSTSGAR
jgi:hypothetical protein